MAYQPKSYRKFLVGAVSTAVVASSFAGVAGAAANFTDVNDNYKAAVDYLVAKGIQGTSATTFGTYDNIKRVDAAVFVVKALGLDVNAAPASGFTDVPERAVKEVNALKAAGITSGKSATEFGAQDLITRGELAIWLDKAFDLKGEGDVSAFTDANGIYTDAIKALVANNITKGTSTTTFGTKDPAKRGDFAVFVKKSADTIPAPVVDPKVESVSAINALQLDVKFTTAVDEDTAEDLGNYAIEQVAGDDSSYPTLDATYGAELLPDGKTVRLTLDSSNVVFKEGKVIAVAVDGVQVKGDASKVIKYAGTVILTDTTSATITSVKSKASTTTKDVTVEFSEPVQGNGVYKINGDSANASVDANNPRKVTLTTSKALEAGKSYTLGVYNEEDYAIDNGQGNLTTTTESFTVTSQTATEGLQTATVVDDNKIELVFADDMDPSTVIDANIKLLEEDGTALTPTSDYAVTQPDADNDKKFLVTISKDIYADKATRNLSLIVTNAVTDELGNKVNTQSKALSFTKDTTKPVATSARVLKNTDGEVTGFEIKFDSKLAVGAPTTTGFRAINAAGKEITTDLGLDGSTGSVDSDKQDTLVVSVTPVALTSDISGDITLVIPASAAGLTDDSLNKNANAAKSLTVGLGDSSASKLTAVVADDATNSYTVQFSEDVKTGDVAGSATNPANYTLDGTVLPANTVITYDKATTTATIELPASYVTTNANDSILRVSGIKNAAGTKTVVTTVGTVTTVDEVAPVLTSAKFLANNQIELTYSEDLATVSDVEVGNEFKIKLSNGDTVTIADADLTATSVSGFDNKVVLTYASTFDLVANNYTITTADDTSVANDITDDSSNNEQKFDVKVNIQE